MAEHHDARTDFDTWWESEADEEWEVRIAVGSTMDWV